MQRLREISMLTGNHDVLILTIVASQYEVVHWLQAKQGKEIPAQARYPSHVQISSSNTGLQHLLELRRERER